MKHTKTNNKISVNFAYDVIHQEDAKRIREIDKRHFMVQMSGHGRPGLRLELHIHSEERQEVDFTLEIDWGSESRAIYIDYLFVKNRKDKGWRMIPCLRDGKRIIISFELAPGTTQVASYPIYSYRDCKEFVEKLRKNKRITVTVPGYSEEGRKIWLIKVSHGGNRPNCLVIGRCHAYETAGNYCVEGMVDFILSGSEISEFFLRKYNFYFIPMMNPDGVANGLGYLTPGGSNLNRDIECNKKTKPGSEKDKALLTHFKVIDELKPAAYLNIHHWKNKFDDGLICWDEKKSELFRSFMSDQTGDYKRWRTSTRKVPGQRSPGRYCEDNYGTVGYVLEFPWYGRSTDRMRQIGETALKALIHTTMEIKQKRELSETSQS